jgi:hypothetical protein
VHAVIGIDNCVTTRTQRADTRGRNIDVLDEVQTRQPTNQLDAWTVFGAPEERSPSQLWLAEVGSKRKRIPWLICKNDDDEDSSSGLGSTNRRRASLCSTDRMKMIR